MPGDPVNSRVVVLVVQASPTNLNPLTHTHTNKNTHAHMAWHDVVIRPSWHFTFLTAHVTRSHAYDAVRVTRRVGGEEARRVGRARAASAAAQRRSQAHRISVSRLVCRSGDVFVCLLMQQPGRVLGVMEEAVGFVQVAAADCIASVGAREDCTWREQLHCMSQTGTLPNLTQPGKGVLINFNPLHLCSRAGVMAGL